VALSDVQLLRIRRQTRGMQKTPLDWVTEGKRVKVTGCLEVSEQLLRAPITGRLCAAWSVAVQEHPSWDTSAIAQETQDFALRDGSTRPATVRAAGAILVLKADTTSRPNQPTDGMLALLRRHSLREDGYSADGRLTPYRYCEGMLQTGDPITVVGMARLEIDPSGVTGSYREPPRRLVFSAAPQEPLWILDLPKRWRWKWWQSRGKRE
jgi:hypothetical protein